MKAERLTGYYICSLSVCLFVCLRDCLSVCQNLPIALSVYVASL